MVDINTSTTSAVYLDMVGELRSLQFASFQFPLKRRVIANHRDALA